MHKFILKSCFLVIGYCIVITSQINPVFASEDEEKLVEMCRKSTKEIIVSSKTFIGKLDSFIWGDYFHSQVKDKNGYIHSFFSNSYDSCFMALHKGEQLIIEYNVMCQYFEYGGGYYPSDVITQIKTKKTNLKSWKKNFGYSRDSDTCDKLVERYTLKQ